MITKRVIATYLNLG